MKRILKSLLLAGASVALLAIARPAGAQTITISANVPARCTFSNAANIAFPGTYDGTADVTATGTITTQCTRGTDYTISISEGNDPALGSRQMEHTVTAGEFLAYDLYQDAGYATAWRETTPLDPPGTSTSNAPVVHNVYARIALGQDPLIGAYQDVVTVTVTP